MYLFSSVTIVSINSMNIIAITLLKTLQFNIGVRGLTTPKGSSWLSGPNPNILSSRWASFPFTRFLVEQMSLRVNGLEHTLNMPILRSHGHELEQVDNSPVRP